MGCVKIWRKKKSEILGFKALEFQAENERTVCNWTKLSIKDIVIDPSNFPTVG